MDGGLSLAMSQLETLHESELWPRGVHTDQLQVILRRGPFRVYQWVCS